MEISRMNKMVDFDKVLQELETLMNMGDVVAKAAEANEKYSVKEKTVAKNIGDNFSFALKTAYDHLIMKHKLGAL
jgi:uncharacterized protein with PIN domain